VTLGLDLFAPGAGDAIVLTGTRVTGLMIIAPSLSSAIVPSRVRAGVVIALTALLAPMAFAAQHQPHITAMALASEMLIGFALGFGASVLVGAAEQAGDAMAVQMGLSGIAILDPLAADPVPVLGSFLRLFAITLLLSLNLHVVMISTLAESFRAVPLGTAPGLSNGIHELLGMGATMFALGVRFAAPVIAVILIVNVALAVMGRAAPQLNVLTVAFPTQIAAGLFALAAAVPAMAVFFGGWDSVYHGMVARAVGGFTFTGR
jgi:flagellar biosynthetic protein FliR